MRNDEYKKGHIKTATPAGRRLKSKFAKLFRFRIVRQIRNHLIEDLMRSDT